MTPPVAPKRKLSGSARRKLKVAIAAVERIKAGTPVEKPPEPAAQPSAPPSSLVDLGPPPADPLEANAWAHRATLLAMHNAATDPRISERERRKEIRTLGASAAKLLPDARRWEAEQLIRADREELERKQRRRAKLETVSPSPPGDGAVP